MAKFWISLSNGCWVDLFESPGLVGRSIRLHGPADFVNLWVGPEEWGDYIGSLAAGPGAFVLCFEELNLEESATWLTPGQRIPNISELRAPTELDSIRLFNRPPFDGEPGFTAYARAHGKRRSNNAKLKRPALRQGRRAR